MEHKTQDELQSELEKVKRRVGIGDLYYHYKHPEKYYVVEFVGFLESNEEVCVGYRSLYGKGILWVRMLADFTAEVEVNGEKVKRFQLVGE